MEKISENINREDMLELTRRMTVKRTSMTRREISTEALI